MLEHKDFKFDIKGIDDEGKFSGYASTFGNEDRVGDIVQKGAFTKTLQKGVGAVQMFYQHDSSEIIGEFTKLHEDEKGLFFEGQLFIKEIKRAQEAHFLMQKNKLKAVSIGYRIESKGYDDAGRRLLKQVDLMEISVVTYPANPEATIDRVKSIKDMTVKEFEDCLRDAGLSRREARAVIADGYKGLVCDAQEPKAKNEWSELCNMLESQQNKSKV